MSKNSTSSYASFLLLGLFLFSGTNLFSQTNKTSESEGNWFDITWSPEGNPTNLDHVIIDRRVVIPKGTTVEIASLDIAMDGVLVVNGVLKISGNLEMSHNTSQFQMGDTAYVIVDGNFSASNQVSISVSSYLIIYGDFTKNGSSTQGDLTVEGGNIYIFGEVDENWNDFETCEQYAGDTGAIETEDCDYGTGESFEDNQDEFPDELKDLIPCLNSYTWTGIADSNWNNTANWSCNSLPTLETHVTIPAETPFSPILNSGEEGFAKDLVIQLGAELRVVNRQLSVAGELSVTGTLDVTSGSFAFVGLNSQTIPAGTFFNNELQNLRINNPEGVNSEATINIKNSLKVEEGIFNTGDKLTLISDALGTAFIDGSGIGEVSGSVTAQRYLSNGFGYKYFSSPFRNSTVADFAAFMELENSSTGFPHFYEYRENHQDENSNDLTGWKTYTQTTAQLNVGEGYALNISGVNDPVTIEISGEVNNGAVEVALENSSGLYTRGFNLVGNPYPSPVDWNAVTLEGIDDAIYFFAAGSDNRYTGQYTSYVNGISSDGLSSNVVPSMQGFFVRVSESGDDDNPGTGIVRFTNAARTGNSNPQNFYQTKNPRAIAQMRLSAGFSNEEVSDATVIYFSKGATVEFEKNLDAFKMLNTAAEIPSLYSLTREQEKLSINAISSGENQEIPLGIKTERSGKMFINLAETESIYPSTNIYLKDNEKKVMHNLSDDPVYPFTSQKGENNERFSLIFSSKRLFPDRAVFEQFSVDTNEGEIRVKLDYPKDHFGKITLSNISGQILQKKDAKGKELIKFGGIYVPGVYLVSLEIENERLTKKILVKN